MEKTILSFYCDDTNPYNAPPEAFKTFLNFAASEGIAGEASLIFGFDWAAHGLISRPTTPAQSKFLEQARRAFLCGIDTQFELMTHWGLFDFANNQIPPDAIHEGLWMFEPDVSVQEYEAYFGQILAEGECLGIRFTGLTQPGCSCQACNQRFQELNVTNMNEPNPKVWQALLNLANAGRFRGPSVPCFFGGALEDGTARRMAGDGLHAVYDFQPNMKDRFGSWTNALEHADVDYYITADGQSGRIVELVRAHAPYCLFYSHWQGLNPANGVGWPAFMQMVRRVQKYLHEEVVWMRPSQYTDHLLQNTA